MYPIRTNKTFSPRAFENVGSAQSKLLKQKLEGIFCQTLFIRYYFLRQAKSQLNLVNNLL